MMRLPCHPMQSPFGQEFGQSRESLNAHNANVPISVFSEAARDVLQLQVREDIKQILIVGQCKSAWPTIACDIRNLFEMKACRATARVLSPMRPLLQAKAASMENRKSPSGMKGRFRVVPAHGAPEEQACHFRGRVPYAVGIALANECSSFPALSSWHTPVMRFELSWPSPFAAKESS